MLLVTDTGYYFTVVEDFDDPNTLWVRSQERASVQDAAETIAATFGREVEVLNEPSWDYQFRIAASRDEWADYLRQATQLLRAHKLKPAVAEARGADHPVARMVEEVFYYMSNNRPDGSLPAWLGGGNRRRR